MMFFQSGNGRRGGRDVRGPRVLGVQPRPRTSVHGLRGASCAHAVRGQPQVAGQEVSPNVPGPYRETAR
eukprot:4603798-Alexandrium_andersonii.AAC.1